MGGERHDLIVYSQGQCFLCLRQINQLPRAKCKQENLHGPFPTSHRSLRCLSRYLRLDVNIFYENTPAGPTLFEKDQRLELKSELCKGCSCLVDTFSQKFRQLEKIQMEIASTLGQIHHQLLNSEQCVKPDKFQGSTDSGHAFHLQHEQLKEFNVLRSETRRKCNLKLTGIRPRVRIQNLTMKEAREGGRRHIISDALQKASSPEVEIGKIKIEQVPLNLILDKSDDDDGDDCANSYLEEDPLSDGLTSPNPSSCQLYEGHQVQCHKCNKVFKWKCNLVNHNHQQTHCPSSRCIYCDKEFPDLPSLDRHISTAHIQIPVNTDELVNLPPEEFNARVWKFDLSKAQISAIRKVRRRMRNRISAMKSRDRKRNEFNQLEREVEGVRETKGFLVGERKTLLDKRNQLVERYNLLYDAIFQTLRDVDGNLYNPNECDLEQDQNGMVVMLPRNTIQ